MIEFFIDVAKECINIGNFNSLMAIIGECPMNGDFTFQNTFKDNLPGVQFCIFM